MIYPYKDVWIGLTKLTSPAGTKRWEYLNGVSSPEDGNWPLGYYDYLGYDCGVLNVINKYHYEILSGPCNRSDPSICEFKC